MVAAPRALGPAARAYAQQWDCQVAAVDTLDEALGMVWHTDTATLIASVDLLGDSPADLSRIAVGRSFGVIPVRNEIHMQEVLAARSCQTPTIAIADCQYVSISEVPSGLAHPGIKVWRRTDLRLPVLSRELRERPSALVLVGHGHADRLYLGTEAVRANADGRGGGILTPNQFPAALVFLNSCFSAQATQGSLPPSERLGVNWFWSGARAVIGSTGVNVASDAEALMFLELLSTGLPVGVAVSHVNSFLRDAGIDVGPYLLIGEPRLRFAMPWVDGNPREAVHSLRSGEGLAAGEAAEGERFFWRKRSGAVLMFGWDSPRPRGNEARPIDLSDLGSRLRSHDEAVGCGVRALRRLRIDLEPVAGLVREMETSVTAASRALARGSYDAGAAAEAERRIAGLDRTLAALQKRILVDLCRRIAHGPFVFHERYRPGFLVRHAYWMICPRCRGQARRCILQHVASLDDRRRQVFCVQCGVLSDEPAEPVVLTEYRGPTLVLRASSGHVTACVADERVQQPWLAPSELRGELEIPRASHERRLVFVLAGLRLAHFALTSDERALRGIDAQSRFEGSPSRDLTSR